MYRTPRLKQLSELCFTQGRADFPREMTPARLAIFEDILRKISNFRKLNRILDVGSGRGVFLKMCNDEGWFVSGVEVDPSLVDFTKREYDIQISNNTLDKSNFPNDYFDVVTFINVLEHCHYPTSIFNEAYKILRPGGAVLIRTPNAALHVNSKRVFSKLYWLTRRIKSLDYSVIYIYSYDRVTINNFLSKNGFSNIQISNDSLRSQNIVSKLFGSLMNTIEFLSKGRLLISPSLFIIASKPT